jgi:hypothetical protein
MYKIGMVELAEAFNGQVFRRVLRRIGDIALPDVMLILPYLGLFTIMVLRPGDMAGCTIPMPQLPTLLILQNNQFVPRNNLPIPDLKSTDSLSNNGYSQTMHGPICTPSHTVGG